ncbi:fumarylacetoacetate hydrolase family protein [Pantoea eucalypti]|jgi:2,4-diketo-3-deoxy-L-fuconate hydrolase|uniref:2-keto-4-pentenoate hydratase/2-oxohepta-3-ene-1,7-dioic acid hydratase in catechol pathway n=3 Tax=Pantoea TaxID=53335 RepID=A0ABD6XK73_ENTAG|nr:MULTISPECIES: fumarylacetoacetate hydrolase family protein [Pantoea]MBW1216305.1 fumarylacetoacetate hydrolase family protein [Pantoea allii]MBW1255443.1 fumarylacetoacetate hydrolase family protein [Pantoea allii]MBW1259943.1 fumarylacetoacetate hydrolase family protein [Pantoea allii]MBW1264509.1 fumarylacetoacetate hydrolase family protein [Pantoea allii]MBW1269043.1 fumarylacetoacetate hydrolase family protein [Pantoea allii]
MKICRYGDAGFEKPGVFDSNLQLRDLSGIVSDVTPGTLTTVLNAFNSEEDVLRLPIVPGNPRLGPPLSTVSKFVAIGLNYRDHALEANLPIPDEPVVFFKAPSCINGPDDDIIIPPHSTKLDWEAELGIVIATKAKQVSQENALEYVAGYCIVNDVSDRGFQFQSSQWDKAKSCDTFGPMGPYIVTRDEVCDPQNLSIWLEVNGERRQFSHTSQMIFSVAEIVSYVSHYMTLLPGDVIATGTPAGVSLGMKPEPVWLKEGDSIRIHVEKLGYQNQTLKR